jgi:hypothetical protein
MRARASLRPGRAVVGDGGRGRFLRRRRRRRQRVVVDRCLEARDLGRQPGLVLGHGQLAGHLVERSPHDVVGAQQPLAAGEELVELRRRRPALAGQVLEDALADGLRLANHLPAAVLGLLHGGLGRRVSVGPDLVGVGPGRVEHRGRLGLGLLAAPGEERLGLRAQTGGFVVRLPEHPGHRLLGVGPDLGRGLSGGVQDPGGLGAEDGLELVLVDVTGRPSLLSSSEALTQTLLPLAQRGELGRDLGEEGPDLVLVEAAERGSELLAGDVVSADRLLVGHLRDGTTSA